MKEIVMNEPANWKTFAKYGIIFPLCVILTAASPLLFGPICAAYLYWHRDYYFKEEEVEGV